jgi:hypothetical protein
MKTYIPRQPRQTRERLEIKLERSLLQNLERYCEYLESDRDYVIGCLLQIVFRKDKGFGDWLRSKPSPVSVHPQERRPVQAKGA